ncbi:DNA primase [Frateuria aurantia]|uniref:DNA primase n=1 Tax=Frateuria aurantia (strain ATCC 33424 / DSM 6220 / KCTC 2777 / LMG 1558 / NBRC 3245 / NCIMB 13370) TaxID=767434 RepID=H8KZL5_FRAAD|nr:DNA primase [Frateuria aurantia]AFC87075.1 DNA primase, catalytic core [Frateuria aurantia DSM 6220]
MRGLIPERFIDELLTRVDIVDVIQHRVPLKKAGREWTACCPFHNERSPSFYVSPSKQFYHCFGCGAHGSALKFLMEYERLEFPDAVEELAKTVGLTVPREGGQQAPREDRSDSYSLLDEAASWYQQQLAQDSEAQAYCRQRGLDPDIISRFRIGWAPAGYDGLSQAVGRQQARKLELLSETGMLASGDHGRRYDRFRQRLMFPIMDRRGRVIAFGGRLTGSEQGPKYLNSPETPLFHKGRELFALWQVKQANPKLERIVVVEGYMDAIAMHQAGLPIAVATLGTATTPEHTEQLFRATADVVFCFDGDRAGRAAAWKALEATLPRMRDGRQAGFLFLPDGEDPDSLIRQEGQAGFQQRISQAMPLSDYLFNELSRDVDTTRLEGRARLAERARPLIARLPDGAFRDLMAEELERRSGARAQLGVAPAPPRPARVEGQRTLVRSVIALLLAQPEVAREWQPPYPFAQLELRGISLLLELIELIQRRPGAHAALLIEHFAERPEYAALQKLMTATLVGDPETQKQELRDAIGRLQHQAHIQRRHALQARLGQLNDAEKEELRQLLPLREHLRGFADA